MNSNWRLFMISSKFLVTRPYGGISMNLCMSVFMKFSVLGLWGHSRGTLHEY